MSLLSALKTINTHSALISIFKDSRLCKEMFEMAQSHLKKIDTHRFPQGKLHYFKKQNTADEKGATH